MDLRDEIGIKQARVDEFLGCHGLDGVLLTRRCNFSWFTAGAYSHVNTATELGTACLLVTRAGAKVFTTNIEAERFVGEALTGRGLDVMAYPWHDDAARVRAIAEATAGLALAADAPVAGVQAAPMPDDFDTLRWTLLAPEMDRYRQVARDVVDAVQAVARSVPAGVTEFEVAGRLNDEMFKRGCLPWVALVANEDRVTRYRHPLPTEAPIRRYAMLVACGERAGLVASCTRFYHFGPVPNALARNARAAAAVDAAMIDATRPGTTLGAVFARGIQAYAAEGFADQWQMHHQGGLAGYLPREVIATPGCPVPVQAGQAFAWNPSITGTKSEDTILCHADGPEILGDDDWPMIEVSVNGKLYRRPGLLVR